MQWSSAAEHLVSSILSGKQRSSCQSIRCIHLCRQAEVTSRTTFVLEGSETSEPEVDDYIIKKTSGDSHQEGRSSLTMAIRSSRRVESCHQVEEYQSVIILDYIFLTDPHHDIARRVSSNIKQLESSSGDPSHPRIISLGITWEHISASPMTKGGYLALVFIIRSTVILLHLHQVWQVHLRWLQAFHPPSTSAHPSQRPHRSPIKPLEIGNENENKFGDAPHIFPRHLDASTEMSQEELPFPMASQPLRHLCGHLHHLEEADPHFLQSSVGIKSTSRREMTERSSLLRSSRSPCKNIPRIQVTS